MQFFVVFLLIFRLLCLFLPSAALDNHSADVDLEANHVEIVVDSTGTTTAASSRAPLPGPSLQLRFASAAEAFTAHQLGIHLRFASAVQAFAAPQPSPSNFWEMAEEYEQILQKYVPLLLINAETYFKSTAFTDVTNAINDIVRLTATFRDDILDVLDSHHVTLDRLTTELEAIFMEILHDLENIPPPRKAPGNAERNEMVNKVLDDTELALTDLLALYGVEEEVVTAYLDALRPHVCALTVAVGDIIEQHPQLLPALTFSVAALLIPESWILRPFLSIFGFGPTGPVKGSTAAWIQRRFWGSAIRAGTWFAWLQASGMDVIPEWAGTVTQAPVVAASLLAMLIPCFRRGQLAE